MSRFLRLTDSNNRPMLVNVEHIRVVEDCRGYEMYSNTRVYMRDSSSPRSFKETIEEIEKQISAVETKYV